MFVGRTVIIMHLANQEVGEAEVGKGGRVGSSRLEGGKIDGNS